MLAEERLLRIAEIIRQRETGVVSVSELCQRLGVSPMTVRRDLDRLEEMAILKRVHGGAVAQRSTDDWTPFAERSTARSREKASIGRAAAFLVQEGDVVLFDAGTTTPHVARNLAHRGRITAITHSLPVADEPAQLGTVSTILLGGTLRPNERYTCGPKVVEELARLRADKFFLSAAGLTIENGATDPDPQEVELKRAMAAAASEVILVADSSKWDAVWLVQIAELRAVQTLVTDNGLPPEAIEAIEAEGVRVLTPSRFATQRVLSTGVATGERTE